MTDLRAGVSKSLKKVQMSGKTFGHKSKCLGLNRDSQANPGGVLSGEGVFCQYKAASAQMHYAELEQAVCLHICFDMTFRHPCLSVVRCYSVKRPKQSANEFLYFICLNIKPD